MQNGLEETGGCQPALTCANGVADDRNDFTEHCFRSPPAGVVGLGVFLPETDAPPRVKRAGFRQRFGASAQICCFMAGLCVNFAKVPARSSVFPDAFPSNGIEVTHASADAFVHKMIWREQNELRCAVVQPFQPSSTAPRRSTICCQRQTTIPSRLLSCLPLSKLD